jgi:glutamate--cysteine ligase
LDAAVKRSFDLQVEASLTQQQRLNTTREIPFDKYLNNYFSQDATAGKIYPHGPSQNIPDSFLKNLS